MEVTVRMRGPWMRAERYVVKAGYIVPQGELEPFDVFEETEARLRWGEGRRPYEELAWLDLKDEQAIASWCSRWGLLGILPHELVELWDGEAKYRWEGGRWRGSFAFHRTPPPPYTIIRPFGSRFTNWVDARWARRFFPDLEQDEEQAPLLPTTTERFWALYREPVDHFVAVAETLSRAFRALKSEDPEDRQQAVAMLAGELAEVRMIGAAEPDQPTVELVAPTLLAAIVAMLHAELQKGFRVELCKRCQLPFVAATPREKYHSKECRLAQAQTAYMRRRRQAVRLYRQGLSIDEIAARLNADPSRIAGWVQERREE